MRFAITALLLIAVGSVSLAQTQQRQRVPVRPQPGQIQGQTLTGMDGLRALYKSGKSVDVERFAPVVLWQDIRQPEALYILASSEERLRKPQEAAVYYTLFLRTMEEGGGADVPPDIAKQKPAAERRLKALKQDEATLAAAYAKTAPGKKFGAPEDVDDGWMNNVKGDLFSLHGLYAWKLVGGRKDAKPDWIHNTQGAVHRSGMKYVPEVEGRKGVLFTVPLKDMNSADADASNREALSKLGHNSHAEARNVGKCKFVRVGARGYGFPFTLKVLAGGKELAKESVTVEKWSDVKVELPPAEGKEPQTVSIEFIVPEGQQHSEGVWLDYFDFFDD